MAGDAAADEKVGNNENNDGSDDEDLFGDGDNSAPPATKNEAKDNEIPGNKEDAVGQVVVAATAKADPAPSPPASRDTSAAKADGSFIPGPAHGLPEGVKIPSSMDTKLLKDRLFVSLKELPISSINDALVEFTDAVAVKGGAIRNHGAYLYGVVKRYISVQERAKGGEGKGILPMGAELTPAVNERLRKLVSDGFCTEAEMNEKVRAKIKMLSEKDALLAVDELQSNDRHQIRNFGSYFMGILNRYMRGEPNPVASQKRSQKAPGSPRRDQYSNRNKQIRDHNESYRQNRPRDRYEDEKRQRYSHPPGPPPPPPPPHRQDQPNPYMNMSNIQGQQRQMSQPPPPPPRNQPGPPQSMNMVPNFARQQHMQQQSAFVSSQQQFVPPMQMQNNMPPGLPMQMGMNQAPNFAQPPPPPPQQQQQQQSHLQMQNMPSQQQYPPPQGPPLAPNSYHPQSSYPPVNGPQTMWQQPQQGQGLADILALADKASNAVQALSSQGRPGAPQMYAPPPGPAMAQQQLGIPPPPMHNSHPPPNSMPAQQQHSSGTSRRRTTASFHELTPAVQQMVLHLQNTGQINGPLDDGMLGMVKDLPEPIAMEAFQKFISIDKNTMRNRTAYLAGVLRRELEKINRR